MKDLGVLITPPTSEPTASPSPTSKPGDLRTCLNDGEWRLNVEQITASVLADTALSNFFERKYPLLEAIERYRAMGSGGGIGGK